MIDAYTAAFVTAITPQIFVSIIGGVIGTNISSDVRLYGIRLTILTAIVTLSIVGVASEYMSYKWGTQSIIGHFALGAIVGMAGMRLLDAIRLALPDLMNRLTELAGKSSLELIEMSFDKIKKLLKI